MLHLRFYHAEMKLMTAQVIAGRIDVPPEIADGTQVAILAPDSGEPVALSPADEQELSEALADIQAGKSIDGRPLASLLSGNDS